MGSSSTWTRKRFISQRLEQSLDSSFHLIRMNTFAGTNVPAFFYLLIFLSIARFQAQKSPARGRA